MSKTRKSLIAIACLIVLSVTIGIYLNISAKKAFESATNEAFEKSQTIGKKYGVEITNVTLSKTSESYWYEAWFTISDFNKLSFDNMYKLSKELDDIRVNNRSLLLRSIQSGNDSYRISTSSRRIYLNGEKIHDDYYNSIEYKKSTESSSSIYSNTSDQYLDTVRCYYCSKVIRSDGVNIHGTPKYNGGVLVCDYCGHETSIKK